MPRNSLFPIEYDEISLVDSGAAGDAHVVILKRDISKAKKKKPKKGTVVAVSVPAGKKPTKKAPTRNSKNPCATGTNSTGAKDSKKKKSQRGENWKEERHPRNEDGTMKQSSADSKSAYGKGGTTKSKLDAKCKKKKKPKKGTVVAVSVPAGKPKAGTVKPKPKKKKVPAWNPVKKSYSSLGSCFVDASVMEIMERKAAR